ncbi:DNA-binding transcriptional regulator, CsgD family [Geodermatophilus dictyosporus]|uniref:DNA-binding transcriptional regulator, CsgD family n=1 Tax=Geodermatophilus dictyosporus TaxID=1523247 RepID=A0A1I5MUW1_9ACTN|nr:response regulator transcription factor [Geodermatophilus dictyosporus]SFP13270.1 DNA-binding transcriptional regulator, CsgD family [Geodermatophilus dictyosporus]
MSPGDDAPRRVAVVAASPGRRAEVLAALEGRPGVHPVAWADAAEWLAVLDTRADVCLCDAPPPAGHAARLRERGCRVVVLAPGEDVAAALDRTGGPPAAARPELAPRQREVLVAYVSTNEVQSAVARTLGMEPETLKTHLRRIRLKYEQVGRPAPTRRDLYVRAIEDGLLPPPTTRP